MRLNPVAAASSAILTVWQNRPGYSLLAIVLVAYVLRLLLIVNGGQFYFPDEHRYRRRSVAIAGQLFDGDIRAAVKNTLRYKNHHGMIAAMLPPALVHRLVWGLSGDKHQTWTQYWDNPDSDFRLSAVLLAIPSALCIALVYFITLQAGAGTVEALLAALFMAASSAMFIYAKHFVPYDISMLFSLLALWAALRYRDACVRGGALVGLLLFCSFWIYFGQIFLVATLALLYVVLLARRWQDIIPRAAGMALGALPLLIPILGVNYLVLDRDVFEFFFGFAGGIILGSYAEGVVFPFLYLASAEGLAALVWMLGLGLALLQLRQKPSAARSRLRNYLVRRWLFSIA